MVLNYIWIAFLLIAFAAALYATITTGDTAIWGEIMGASFDQAAFAFEISIGLTGVLALWLGIMKIGERAGVTERMSRMISPLFTVSFPGFPRGIPLFGAIFMNISANMLGLDNAATPMGLKAHAGDADPEPSKGHRHRRADHVPGAQLPPACASYPSAS